MGARVRACVGTYMHVFMWAVVATMGMEACVFFFYGEANPLFMPLLLLNLYNAHHKVPTCND